MMLNSMQLDGHTLYHYIANHVSRGIVNPYAPIHIYYFQLSTMLDTMSDCLYNDIHAAFEIEHMESDEIARIDSMVEENMPELLNIAEEMLEYIYDVIRQYSAPPGCKERLDYYFDGYTPLGDYAGALHFDFDR